MTRRRVPGGLTSHDRHRANARQAVDAKYTGDHNRDGQQQQTHLPQ